MKHLYLVLFVICSTFAYSQDYGTAVMIAEDERQGSYEKAYLEYFENSFFKTNPGNVEMYDWDGKPSSQPIRSTTIGEDIVADKPIKTVIVLDNNFSLDESKLNTAYKKDTSGKITNMYLYHPFSFVPVYKMIDLPTSTVLASTVVDTKEWKLDEKWEVKDFKRYFGSNPENTESNGPAWSLKMKAYKKLKGDDIKEWYNERMKDYGNRMGFLGNKAKSINDSKMWKPMDLNVSDKGKVDNFYIDATQQENLNVGDGLDIYVKTKFNDFEQFDRLSVVTVKEVGTDKALVKPFSLQKKKISEALMSGNEVVFVRNENLVRSANRGNAEMQNVQVKGECFACNMNLERMLMRIAAVNLVERNFDTQRKFFTDQYKDEKYIDFDMADLQDKQQGINYIFEKTASGVQATDVETGRVATAVKPETKGLKALFATANPQVRNLCMDILGQEIQIIEILKEKKGKIDKFMAYSPLGISQGGALKIVVLVEETVGGRTVVREEEIGKAWVGKTMTETIGEVKVSKGEKDLYEALQNGSKVVFRS